MPARTRCALKKSPNPTMNRRTRVTDCLRLLPKILCTTIAGKSHAESDRRVSSRNLLIQMAIKRTRRLEFYAKAFDVHSPNGSSSPLCRKITQYVSIMVPDISGSFFAEIRVLCRAKSHAPMRTKTLARHPRVSDRRFELA